LGRAVTGGGGTFSAASRHGTERLFEHLAIKEEQGVEGLVLGGGGNIGFGEVGQESLDLLFGRAGSGVEAGEKARVTLEPLGISLLGADGEMF